MEDLKPLSMQIDEYIRDNSANLGVAQVIENFKPLSKVLEEMNMLSLSAVLNSPEWLSTMQIVSANFKNSKDEKFKDDISYITKEIINYNLNDQEPSISLEDEDFLPKSREELIDTIKIAIREVNKEKPNEPLLKKIFSNRTIKWLFFVILGYMTEQVLPYTPLAKVIPFLMNKLSK